MNLHKLRGTLDKMTPEDWEKYFPEDKTPKGWVSIEEHLPMMNAIDFIEGTKYKVKFEDESEGESCVGDHNVWYYLAREAGITHWWNE